MQEVSTNPNGAEGSHGENMPPFMIKSPISFLCSGPPHYIQYFQGPREIPENTSNIPSGYISHYFGICIDTVKFIS